MAQVARVATACQSSGNPDGGASRKPPRDAINLELTMMEGGELSRGLRRCMRATGDIQDWLATADAGVPCLWTLREPRPVGDGLFAVQVNEVCVRDFFGAARR